MKHSSRNFQCHLILYLLLCLLEEMPVETMVFTNDGRTTRTTANRRQPSTRP